MPSLVFLPLFHSFHGIKCMHVKRECFPLLYLKLLVRLWDECWYVCKLVWEPDPRWNSRIESMAESFLWVCGGGAFVAGRCLWNGIPFFPKMLPNPSSSCLATRQFLISLTTCVTIGGRDGKEDGFYFRRMCRVRGSLSGIHGVSLKILK